MIEKALGVRASEVEEVPSESVRLQFLTLGGVRFEFLEPTDKESPIFKFIEKRGAGMHHVAFKVRDINQELSSLKSQGVKLINEVAKEGAEGCKVAFIHPRSTPGLLVELVE